MIMRYFIGLEELTDVIKYLKFLRLESKIWPLNI